MRDAKGDTYTVPYDAVNAMLLNELLKECRKIDAQVGEIRREDVSSRNYTIGLFGTFL